VPPERRSPVTPISARSGFAMIATSHHLPAQEQGLRVGEPCGLQLGEHLMQLSRR
jgi:hypothetical protein